MDGGIDAFRGDSRALRPARPAHGYALGQPRSRALGRQAASLARHGATWEEVEAPKYPEGDTVPPDFSVPAKTNYIWLIEPGGADEPNRLYLGTDPGGLFVSDDGGDSFQLMETLWRHPTNTHWFGAGRDHPGTVAIVVDPRDSRRLTVGISVGRRLCQRRWRRDLGGAQSRLIRRLPARSAS